MAITIEGDEGTWKFGFWSSALPEAAYGYITDLSRWGEWHSDLPVVSISDEVMAQGRRFKMISGLKPAGWRGWFFSPLEVECTVTAFEPPGRFEWSEKTKDSEGGTHTDHCSLLVEGLGGGRRITLVKEFFSMPKFLTTLQNKLMGDEAQQRFKNAMQQEYTKMARHLVEPSETNLTMLKDHLDRNHFKGMP